MTTKEEFSPEEIEQLKILQAKAKRIQRTKKADEKFFRLADARKDELLERWKISMSSPAKPEWLKGDN